MNPTDWAERHPYRALDEPPYVVAELQDQLSAIDSVATLDRLLERERSGANRKTVIERSEARRRALGGEANGGGAGPPSVAAIERTPPGPPPNSRPRLSPSSVETSAVLAEKLAAPPELADGLHFGLPIADYLAIDAVSNTRLGWLSNSPAHLKAYIEHPPTFVDPESVGSAFHCLVLEGEAAFRGRYVKGPCDDKRMKEWKDYAGALPGNVICLRESDYEAVHAMSANAIAHPAAMLALEGATAFELTGIWTDKATGLRCKLRADAVNPDLGATIDLKSTVEAAQWPFSKAIASYSYHRQGAWYHQGLSLLVPEVDWKHHIIIAVEKDRPWAVQAFRLMDDAIRAGEDEIGRLLPLYEECTRSAAWPAYSENFIDISLPPWAIQNKDSR